MASRSGAIMDCGIGRWSPVLLSFSFLICNVAVLMLTSHGRGTVYEMGPSTQ